MVAATPRRVSGELVVDGRSGAGLGGRGRAEPVEGCGQVGSNLLGHSAFNLAPLQHEHQFAVAKKCDGW